MKILVFTQYYYPEQFLINEITEEMVKRGDEVTVITGLPNYPSGVIPKYYKNGKNRKEVINGVTVIRCPIIARGNSIVTLLANYLSFMFSAKNISVNISDEFDFVFCYELTPITQVYPAIYYCREKKKKLFVYNLDLAPLSGSGSVIRSNLLLWPYKRFSSWIMNNIDMIGVTSESFIEYNSLVNKVNKNRMIYIPQHAHEDFLDIDMQSKDNGVADFMFAGNIGKGASLITIVYASKLLIEKGVRNFIVHIVGDGSYMNEFKSEVERNGLRDYFIFYGKQQMSSMPVYYKKADVLLVTLRKNQITIPGKLQTYMTTGKPIIGAMDGSGKDIIKVSKCGACVEAEDVHGFADLMEDYILHTDKYRECGKNGKEYFKNFFTFNLFMNKLYDSFERMQDNVAINKA